MFLDCGANTLHYENVKICYKDWEMVRVSARHTIGVSKEFQDPLDRFKGTTGIKLAQPFGHTSTITKLRPVTKNWASWSMKGKEHSLANENKSVLVFLSRLFLVYTIFSMYCLALLKYGSAS